MHTDQFGVYFSFIQCDVICGMDWDCSKMVFTKTEILPMAPPSVVNLIKPLTKEKRATF